MYKRGKKTYKYLHQEKKEKSAFTKNLRERYQAIKTKQKNPSLDKVKCGW